MTSEPNLRDRAIDAVGQALNAAKYWLPVEGRPVAVDAVLALVATEAVSTPRQQYAAQVECAIGLNVDRGGVAGVHAVRDAVLAVRDSELEASQRRAVHIQRLLDDQRDRIRKDAAAGHESERQLQQQIEQQAKEIDRLRDELAALHAGEEEPASPRQSGPTPAEWLWHWNHATPAERLDRAALAIDAGQRAGICFQMAHESTIQRLRADQAAVTRVRATLDDLCHEPHPGHDHLCPDDVRAFIRDALHQPKETL